MRVVLPAAVLTVALDGGVTSQQAQTFDILIKGGRVLRAATQTDAARLEAALVVALADPGRMLLAFTRSDSTLVPFAVYAKGTWRGPSDGQMLVGEAPSGPPRSPAWFLAGVPVPIDWYRPGKAGKSIALKSTTPETVNLHCEKSWALRMNAPIVGDKPDPTRSVDVATSPRVETASMSTVAAISPEATRLSQIIRPAIGATEAAYAPGRYGPRLPAAAIRAQVALTWRSVHRIVTGATRVWYAEAEKRYENGTAGCPTRAVMRAWLREDAGGHFTVVDRASVVTDCDGKDDQQILPLAALLIDGRRFVVTRKRGYEGEAWEIVETSVAGIIRRLLVSGGGC